VSNVSSSFASRSGFSSCISTSCARHQRAHGPAAQAAHVVEAVQALLDLQPVRALRARVRGVESEEHEHFEQALPLPLSVVRVSPTCACCRPRRAEENVRRRSSTARATPPPTRARRAGRASRAQTRPSHGRRAFLDEGPAARALRAGAEPFVEERAEVEQHAQVRAVAQVFERLRRVLDGQLSDVQLREDVRVDRIV
jgi:hypothetical protein